MQKWEYQYIVINLNNVVETINGVRVTKGNSFTGIQGERVWEFLNSMGREGWEAVGLDIISGQATAHGRSLLFGERQLEIHIDDN